MKFEHVLQIYWSKGFLTNGKLQHFNTPFKNIFEPVGGFSHPTKKILRSRFELYSLLSNPNQPISSLRNDLPLSLNKLFSKITSINNTVADLTRYNLLRLYLIKTTRGRSHALGKPSRGQRTWSNAWTAYNHNKVTRAFIGEYQKIQNANKQTEKVNYKLLKKKSLRKERRETVSTVTSAVNNWF